MPGIQITTAEAEAAIKALILQFNRLRTATIKMGEAGVISNKQVAAAIKAQESAIKKVIPYVDRLNQSLKNMTKSQRNYKTQLSNTKTALKAVTTQLKVANTALTKMKAKMDQVSKSSLSGMFSRLKNSVTGMLAAFGVLGGVVLFANAIRDAFNLMKKLDSLSFSMKAVITDVRELAQTEKWLIDITNDFGAEIVTTTNRFIKFRAASKQAGLTAKQTQEIFGTLTKAAGVLGLRTDELQGIFLALEQMISKGKITTEELRRQLGERLPGAMDIMANSMGVTTSELDKMLKKGEVITKEVLPGFARQVNIAFGLDKVKRVETLQAATIRLRNAWVNLVRDFNEGSDASGKLMSIFNYLADNLKTVLGVTLNLIAAFSLLKIAMVASNVITKISLALSAALGVENLKRILETQTQALATLKASTAQTVYNAVMARAILVSKILYAQIRLLWTMLVTTPLGQVVLAFGALLAIMRLTRSETEEETLALSRANKKQIELAKGIRETVVEVEILYQRYKELTAQSKLTTEQSKELADIIILIGTNATDAVEEVDKFGQALEITGRKVQDFIDDNRELSEALAQQAILKQTAALQKTKNELEAITQAGRDGQDNGAGTYIEELGKTVRRVNGDLEVMSDAINSSSGAGWVKMSPEDKVAFLERQKFLKSEEDFSNRQIEAAEALLAITAQDEIRKKAIAGAEAFLADQNVKSEAEKAKLTAQYHSDRMKQIQDEMRLTNVSHLEVNKGESRHDAIARKNKPLQAQYDEEKKLYNEIMGIEETTHHKRVKRLRLILDLEEQIKNARLEILIQSNKDIMADEETTWEKRVELARKNNEMLNQIADSDKTMADNKATEGAKKEIADLEQEYLRGSILAEDYAAQVVKINNEKDQKLKLNAQKHTQDIVSNENAMVQEVLSLNKEMYKEQIDQATWATDKKIAELNKELIDKDTTVERRKQINIELKKLAIERINIATKEAIYILKIQAMVAKSMGDTNRYEKIMHDIDLLEGKLQGLDGVFDEMSLADKFQEALGMIQDILGEIGNLYDAFGERRLEQIDAEINALEKKYEKEIELAKKDATTKAALEDELAVKKAILEKERLKEEQRQARVKKAFAIADIAINTSLAISRSTVQAAAMPAIIGEVWLAKQIAFLSILGALQAATVLAQPIPQYAEGAGEIKKEHVGMINDGGQQEYVKRGSNILTTNTKNALVKLKPHDTIYKDYDEMNKDIFLLSALNGGSQISESQFNKLFDGIQNSIADGWREAKISNIINIRNKSSNETYRRSLGKWNHNG